MAETEMASFRITADLLKALRERAEQDGVTLSDVMRDACLMILGVCPTCGQKAPEPGRSGGDG